MPALQPDGAPGGGRRAHDFSCTVYDDQRERFGEIFQGMGEDSTVTGFLGHQRQDRVAAFTAACKALPAARSWWTWRRAWSEALLDDVFDMLCGTVKVHP